MAGDETLIGKLSGTVAEAKALARQDAAARKRAPRILNPDDLRGNVDDFDAADLLTTTLNTPDGKPRPLTADDLAAFRQNVRMLGKRFKGGINPRQVIDMSTAIDRKRAREEILVAVPGSSVATKVGGQVNGLEVRFLTSASRKYGATRHFVTVNFTDYPVAIASGADEAKGAAERMRKQAVRFDCDCGRHRYWYRYVATIGNYHAGRPENGYPKVRNPNLTGVACKHVLRVMAEIEGNSSVQSFLTRAIEKGRKSADGSANIRTRQKDADKQAAKQAARPKASGNTGDADYDRSRAALRKQSRATTTKPKRVASGSKRMAALADVSNAEAEKMFMELAAKIGVGKADQLIQKMRDKK
jgi:hypothetical protein